MRAQPRHHYDTTGRSGLVGSTNLLYWALQIRLQILNKNCLIMHWQRPPWFCDVNGGAALAIQVCFAAHRKVSVDIDEYYRNEGGGVTLRVMHSRVRGHVVPERVIYILNRGFDKSEA